ncbi:MAG: hypothetical protein IJ172_01455, partial [Ruminococcus sp.]|nr:hypothetical protein [Ruminococcus sp.]
MSKLIRFSFFDDLSIAVNYEADPTCFVIFLLAFLIVCYNKSEFTAVYLSDSWGKPFWIEAKNGCAVLESNRGNGYSVIPRGYPLGILA